MGPPLFNGGSCSRSSGRNGGRGRFNGAAALQRRKLSCIGRSWPSKPGFNGAAALQRRKLFGMSSSSTVSRCGFNGAAALQRRKFDHRRRRCLDPVVASMGPPLFNGGSHPEHVGDRRGESASMGPPLFNGGSASCTTPSASATLRLQWGRRSSTAEVGRADRQGHVGAHASMGPPLGFDVDDANRRLSDFFA